MTGRSEENEVASPDSSPNSPYSEPGQANSSGPIRVLLVDDDDDFREAVGGELEDAGFEVSSFGDGGMLLQHLGSGNVADIVVLDWRLRNATGLDILAQLQRRGVNLPVIFLTGVATTEHERLALDHGAVDFVDKLRGTAILERRIRIVVETERSRNGAQPPEEEIVCGDIVLKPRVSRAHWKGMDVDLTVTEFNIVHQLVAHAGDHVTYRAIYDCVHWKGFAAGSGDDGYRTNVRSSIKRIRRKFGAIDGGFSEIENFPAFGYRWRGGTDRLG